jgi:hypothetical protein
MVVDGCRDASGAPGTAAGFSILENPALRRIFAKTKFCSGHPVRRKNVGVSRSTRGTAATLLPREAVHQRFKMDFWMEQKLKRRGAA